MAYMVNIKTPIETRTELIIEIERLVCNDRNVTHGDAEDNFKDIASLWNAYLHSPSLDPLDAKDVAVMMCLFKISRIIKNKDNLENWKDLAGYAVCGGGIVMQQTEKKES